MEMLPLAIHDFDTGIFGGIGASFDDEYTLMAFGCQLLPSHRGARSAFAQQIYRIAGIVLQAEVFGMKLVEWMQFGSDNVLGPVFCRRAYIDDRVTCGQQAGSRVARMVSNSFLRDYSLVIRIQDLARYHQAF